MLLACSSDTRLPDQMLVFESTLLGVNNPAGSPAGETQSSSVSLPASYWLRPLAPPPISPPDPGASTVCSLHLTAEHPNIFAAGRPSLELRP